MDYTKYGSDKETEHQYFTEVYESLFSLYREAPVRFLELGLWGGGCLHLWHEFFHHLEKQIVGIDIRPIQPNIANDQDIFFYQADQSNEKLMTKISMDHGPWDIIMDDASHRGHETMASIFSLWKFLKPGGIYVVEDIFYAWPHAHTRQLDGDVEPAKVGDMINVPLDLIKMLPEFGVREFHIDYRRESGVLWMKKEWDEKFMTPEGVPVLPTAKPA